LGQLFIYIFSVYLNFIKAKPRDKQYIVIDTIFEFMLIAPPSHEYISDIDFQQQQS